MIKKSLLVAANSKRIEQLVSANRHTSLLVSRYVAGTTLDHAIAATKDLNAKGIGVSLDLLGETVSELAESTVATQAYVEAIHRIATDVPGATVSVKLSQLGIALDPAVCQGNLKTLLDAGAESGVTVEVDMEHSSVGPQTLEAFRAVLPTYTETRVAIQAAMRRTPDDLASFTAVKPRIRLVKGAFLESIDKALCDAAEVTAQYRYLTEWALAHLPDPAFGTHDDSCINHVKAVAERLGVGKGDFEFQMLYGVRRDLQEQLAAEGYRIRVYLPYGTQWYPYMMRRMAERPANLMLFARSLISG
jgi:proline dehydrogenase